MFRNNDAYLIICEEVEKLYRRQNSAAPTPQRWEKRYRRQDSTFIPLLRAVVGINDDIFMCQVAGPNGGIFRTNT